MNSRSQTPGPGLLQALFLCSLFLYPFSAAGHTFYLIAQVAGLGLGLLLLPQVAFAGFPSWRYAAVAFAALASSLAFLREVLAGQGEFLEPTKLVLNLATLLLFLLLGPLLDPVSCARWLKRFTWIWLAIVIGAYVHAGTSTFQMLALVLQPEGLTSTRLYELADPLTPIFLTKNILAMFFVAVFGCFLYFRRLGEEPVRLYEKFVFAGLIVLSFSRQALLALVVVLAIDYFVNSGRNRKKWLPVFLIGVGIILGLFLTFAFNFTSYEDGATTRLELWRAFFEHWARFAYLGLGVHDLNASLEHLNIDNYHMFFMNQIAAYGFIHCLAFNLLLAIITLRARPTKIRWILLAPFWLNVCFQTYGYEYGNLFLYCVAANSCNWAGVAQGVMRRQGSCSWVAPLEAR